MMDEEKMEILLDSRRLLINNRLKEVLPSGDTEPVSLHRAMRYSTMNGGKRIRGILCISFHELFGDPNTDAALDAACAIESLHAYTLIHDDLPALDDDDMRRGKPSCHVRFGEAVAILAGDALQAFAFELLSGMEVDDRLKVDAIRILSRTAGSMYLVGGQVADVENEGKEVTEELVEFIHKRKTAELIAASMSLGAVLAAASGRDVEEVHSIGRDVGLAFQIVDDILDEVGDESKVGKKLRKDASMGKITFPALYGLEESRRRARELIEGAVDRVSKLGEADFIIFLFNKILNRAL